MNYMKIDINGRYFMLHDFEDEVWRKVKGYKNYLVSNYGRIKNTTIEKIMTPIIDHTNKGEKYVFKLSDKSRCHKFILEDIMIAVNFKTPIYHDNKSSEYIYDAF